MARRPTSKLQVSGEIWHNRKYSQAAIKGLPVSAETQGSELRPIAGGALICVLAVGMAFLVGKLEPSPDQGMAPIMTTQQGGLYVEYNDRVHPVTNLASARLITGQPDDASVVKEDALTSMPRGPLMGIPSAPSSMAVREDKTSNWGVCDYRDASASLSLTGSSATQTTVVAGADSWSKADTLDDGKAIVARSADNSESLWLLYGSHKSEIDTQDYATQASLGITQTTVNNASVLSEGLLNAIPSNPHITAPELTNHGSTSQAVPRFTVGDVITSHSASGAPTFYLVADDGIQPITEFIADLMVNDGSETAEVEGDDLAVMPQANVINTDHFPRSIPEIESPASACYVWTRPTSATTASPHIVYADALPLTDKAGENSVPLLQGPRGSSTTAQNFVTSPGKGWYVQITGDGETSDVRGQRAVITDDGTRYNLMPDEDGNYDSTLEALGLGGDPLPIPDSVARMLPTGSDLGQKAALVEHVQIPVDLNDGNAGTPPKPDEQDTGQAVREVGDTGAS